MPVSQLDTSDREQDLLISDYGNEITHYSAVHGDSKPIRVVSDLPKYTWRLFCGVCIISVLDGVQLLTFKPTQLLFLKSIGLSTETDVAFFVLVTALSETTPIFASAFLGIVASRIGSARTLCIACLIVCASILSLIISRSRVAVAAAFVAYGFCISGNTLRQIFITENIPAQCRTEALSMYTFVSSIGALLGPLVWLLCNRFTADIALIHGVVLNKFTLAFSIVAGIICVMAVLSIVLHFGCKYSRRELAYLSTRQNSDVDDDSKTERSQSIWTNQSKLLTFLLFGALDLLTSAVTSILLENVQPILVSRFGADGQHLGIVFEIVTIAELLPPLLVAFVSRYLKDREIMFIGILIKVIGGILYLPVIEAVQEWQVIIGYALNYKSAIFFESAMLSLFSIKFDSDSNSTLLGILASSSAFGYVVSQYAFGVTAVRIFGTFSFAFFLIPLFVALLLLLLPSNWRKLNTPRI